MAKINKQQINSSSYQNHHNGQIVPTKISYEAFLDWADEDTLAEWVDGEIIMTSPASLPHQNLSAFLLRVIAGFAEVYSLGTVVAAPFQMKLPDSGREPDLIFINNTHLGRLRKTFLAGPGDLVIEIISPESTKRDKEDKFQEYAAGKVSEYWLIDPEEKQTQFYQLDEQGNFQAVATDNDGKYFSRELTNFWLKPTWLWQEPLPSVTDVLLEVAGSVYADFLLAQIKGKGLLPPNS